MINVVTTALIVLNNYLYNIYNYINIYIYIKIDRLSLSQSSYTRNKKRGVIFQSGGLFEARTHFRSSSGNKGAGGV